MSVVTEERVERALDIATMIIVREYFGVDTSANDIAVDAYVSCEALATDILAAVAPIIAAQERERAAAMVETSLYIMSSSKPSYLEYDPKRAKNDNHHATIAAAIRALGDAT